MRIQNGIKSNFLVLVFISCLSFFPLCSYSASKYAASKYKDECTTIDCMNSKEGMLNLIIALTGGIAWASPGVSQSFTDDDSLYDYDIGDSSQTVGLWGAFVGGEFFISRDMSIQAGLSYYQTGNFEVEGTVTQGVDPGSSEIYNYEYSIISRQILIEGKLLGSFINNWIHPYISVGLGASFNSVHDYDAVVDTPFPFATFTPQFDGNTNISFSYNLGFGVDFDVATFMRLGLGYRYTDLGQANLGDGMINTAPISNTLEQANLRAQEVFAQLTFVI